jgi:hypothetical protein
VAENPDLRSVRVEVEAHSGEPGDAPSAPTRGRASNLGIVAGVLGLGLAGVLMILALRPDDAGSADAGTAAPTSTALAEVLEDVVGDNQETTASATLFEQTVGADELQSIVRAPVGFLGLTSKETLQITPNIVRSVDGVTGSTSTFRLMTLSLRGVLA